MTAAPSFDAPWIAIDIRLVEFGLSDYNFGKVTEGEWILSRESTVCRDRVHIIVDNDGIAVERSRGSLCGISIRPKLALVTAKSGFNFRRYLAVVSDIM